MINFIIFGKMKRMILKNWMAATLVAGACVFTACSDDEPATPPQQPSVEDVKGSYTGSMQILSVSPTADAGIDGTPVTAIVTSDKVEFKDFPIRDMITKIAGDENADDIAQAIGRVDYSIPYTADIDSENTTVTLTLAPEAMELTSNEDDNVAHTIEVTISATTDAEYVIADCTLEMSLDVDEVKIDGESIEGFEVFTVDFTMTKDEDENIPGEPETDITQLEGEYDGTMSIAQEDNDSLPEPAELAATVTAEQIVFEALPVRGMIEMLMPDADQAAIDGIVETLGDIEYTIPYTAAANENGTAIELALAPAKLTLQMGTAESAALFADEPLVIEVSVTAADKGLYTIESSKLALGLNVDAVTVGGEELPDFESFSLEFEMTKR